MSGYHYARKIEVTTDREPLPRGMRWVRRTKRPPYLVRSDGGGLSTRTDDCATLNEARKVANYHARRCGWAEIFRWAESETQLRSMFVASHERELKA